MRRIAWVLLLLFVSAIPWEYSLVLPAPFGNVARIAGLLVLAAAVPAILQVGRLRTPGPVQWLVLAFYLWFCCTCFWTIDAVTTFEKIRGYIQEMMIVWLAWEFAESPRDLRTLLRAWVAGSWVLAALTLANFASPAAIAASRIRFAATGQDPNDVARFLDFGFPLSALLLTSELRWAGRLLALGYLPLGLVAVLLTASRGGFLAAVVAIAGCAALLARGHGKGAVIAILAAPAAVAALWAVIPQGTLARLATIPAELEAGSLNQRLNILVRGLARLRSKARLRHGRRHLCRGRESGSHRHGPQHGSRHPCRRRAGRLCAGHGHRGYGRAVRHANTWSLAACLSHGPGGLGRYLAGCNGGRKPNHLAAAGCNCARRPLCRRGAGQPRCLFPATTQGARLCNRARL